MDADVPMHPGDGLAALETRILAWVCGEASAAEADELRRLTAARPEWADFKRRMENAGELLEAATARDPEPLRLSPSRRRRLLRNFMPRQNLMIGAAISVSLIAGIALYGERTHYVPPVVIKDPVLVVKPFVLPPDDPVIDDSAPRTLDKPVVAPPRQLDVPPANLPIEAFPQQVEPPAPPGNPDLTTLGPEVDKAIGHRAFSLSDLDVPPTASYRSPPVYPFALRQQGITGEVLVDFIVDPNGVVRNAVAVRATQREFEEAACAAVGKWKFRPGRKGGVAVFVHMQVPIVFTLNAGD